MGERRLGVVSSRVTVHRRVQYGRHPAHVRQRARQAPQHRLEDGGILKGYVAGNSVDQCIETVALCPRHRRVPGDVEWYNRGQVLRDSAREGALGRQDAGRPLPSRRQSRSTVAAPGLPMAALRAICTSEDTHQLWRRKYAVLSNTCGPIAA